MQPRSGMSCKGGNSAAQPTHVAACAWGRALESRRASSVPVVARQETGMLRAGHQGGGVLLVLWFRIWRGGDAAAGGRAGGRGPGSHCCRRRARTSPRFSQVGALAWRRGDLAE